ncbi:MAG: NUDIX hydrolase [Dehalococcoidia bacterium]
MVKQLIAGALARRKKRRIESEDLIASAVLIPIFSRQGQYHLLFTERSDEVDFHKGQVCFPGGKQEPADSTLLETALREAEEEISLRARDVEILGELDDMPTITTNYVISPFVGFIPHPYPFKIDSREIREVFSVPLSFLADDANFREDTWSYEYEGHVIWGATARILRQFVELLRTESGAPG